LKAPQDQSSALALAFQWLSHATTVAAMMLLPGLLGHWLDKRLGTSVWAIGGFLLGLVLGTYYLLSIVRGGGEFSRPSGPSERDGTGPGATAAGEEPPSDEHSAGT
jgi:F0F1-type ATP synthase assembly protein I